MLLGAGCANIMPHQAGQVVGAVVGSAVAPGIGTPIGSMLGALAGLVVQREMNRVDEKRERVELGHRVKPGDAPGAAPDAAGPPAGVLTRVWVDEMLDNGRLIAGHFDSLPVL